MVEFTVEEIRALAKEAGFSIELGKYLHCSDERCRSKPELDALYRFAYLVRNKVMARVTTGLPGPSVKSEHYQDDSLSSSA